MTEEVVSVCLGVISMEVGVLTGHVYLSHQTVSGDEAGRGWDLVGRRMKRAE